MTDAAHQRRQRLTGIALMCATMICFACLDSTAKYLNHHMDTFQVVWARYHAELAAGPPREASLPPREAEAPPCPAEASPSQAEAPPCEDCRPAPTI